MKTKTIYIVVAVLSFITCIYVSSQMQFGVGQGQTKEGLVLISLFFISLFSTIITALKASEY